MRLRPSRASAVAQLVSLPIIVALVAGCAGAPQASPVALPSIVRLDQTDPPAVGIQGAVRLEVSDGSPIVATENGLFAIDNGRLLPFATYPPESGVRSNVGAASGGHLEMAAGVGGGFEYWTSSDAGATWKKSGAIVDLHILDGVSALQLAATGTDRLILASEPSSSNFSFAIAAFTDDGGVNWQAAQAPSDGALSFAHGSWWISGGATGQELSVSSNGTTWRQTTISVDAKEWTLGRVVEVEGVGAVVSVALQGRTENQIELFSAADDRSWALVQSVSRPVGAEDLTPMTAIANDGSWFVVESDGSRVLSGAFGASEIKVVSPNGLAPNVIALAADQGVLTVLASDASCSNGKQTCEGRVIVQQSTDGGQTWSVTEP